MSRSQREGPFGPPPIQRERASYDTPHYWGQAPPPTRYPQSQTPSRRPHPPPQHPQHGRNPHRVPPPPDYHLHRAPPLQHSAQYHQSQHHQYAGRQWREPAEHHYSLPPNYHHLPSRRDIPRGDYGRPHMPMHVEYESPPPTHHPAPRTPPPLSQPIQFKPSSRPELSTSGTKKRAILSPSPKDPKKKKKGDALSLLAKVSTAMADPEEEQKKAAAEGTAAESVGASGPAQYRSPPRRSGESPPAMWTTPKQQFKDNDSSRQITPTSTDVQAHRTGNPPLGGYYQQSYPRYATPSSYASASSSTPHYRGDDSPTAVISERGSFEQDDRIAAYGTPPRSYAEEHSHYAPYTYVQQPRMEDKTVLRKKFSWKHYPELERFLISNRDEYLRHSALNYTAEQKQYNNWLTERLLELAARHHYVFDPEDFNFVAVRDRIRCYYKSYVQTARKRGLPLIAHKSQNKQVKPAPKAEME